MRTAEAQAAQQRRDHHERVRQREFEGQAAGKFEGRTDGDREGNAERGGSLTGCGVVWGWVTTRCSLSY